MAVLGSDELPELGGRQLAKAVLRLVLKLHFQVNNVWFYFFSFHRPRITLKGRGIGCYGRELNIRVKDIFVRDGCMVRGLIQSKMYYFKEYRHIFRGTKCPNTIFSFVHHLIYKTYMV